MPQSGRGNINFIMEYNDNKENQEENSHNVESDATESTQ